MLASNSTSLTPIDSVDWDAHAALMAVPRHNHEHFIRWLTGSVKRQRTRDARSPEESARRRRHEGNADIAKTGRAFIRAIEQGGNPPDLEVIKVIRGYLDQVTPAKLGAPTRANDGIAAFLEGLFIATYAFGGSVTFNRNGKCNVVKLLDALRELMPEKFIPNALPISLIEEILAKVRKYDFASEPFLADVTTRFLKAISENSQEDEHVYVCPACGNVPPIISRLRLITGD